MANELYPSNPDPSAKEDPSTCARIFSLTGSEGVASQLSRGVFSTLTGSGDVAERKAPAQSMNGAGITWEFLYCSIMDEISSGLIRSELVRYLLRKGRTLGNLCVKQRNSCSSMERRTFNFSPTTFPTKAISLSSALFKGGRAYFATSFFRSLFLLGFETLLEEYERIEPYYRTFLASDFFAVLKKGKESRADGAPHGLILKKHSDFQIFLY